MAPFSFNTSSNFKDGPFRAWVSLGGGTAASHYPGRFFRSLTYRFDLPHLRPSHHEARLRFIEPVSIRFDTFPDYLHYEIIPMLWDCWPDYRPMVEHWLRKHRANCAIFTSAQTANYFRKQLPDINILSITEGVDTTVYHAGKPLEERKIDLLEYGSIKRNFFHHHVEGIRHLNRNNAHSRMDAFADLARTISEAKVVIALPRCDTEPEVAQGVETLTQRFWEGMLSRCVLLGRAPKELTDLVGYNPVVTLDRDHADEQVRDIVAHIGDYQQLVDHNRETALRMAPWEPRMRKVMEWLRSLGYEC